MSYSEVYKNIDCRTVEATKELIKTGFWKKDSTVDDKILLCNKWLKAVSEVYEVEVPEFKFDQSKARYRQTGGGIYDPCNKTITLFLKFSLVTFLHEFRHHLQYQKDLKMYKNHKEEDARAWSVSLFKIAAPNSYEKAVENRTLHFY